MKKKEINVILLTRDFNKFREKNLGKRFTNQEMIEELTKMGFVYPSLILSSFLKSGFLEKFNVKGSKLNIFGRIELTAPKAALVIEQAREYYRSFNKKVETPTVTRYLTLDETMEYIREKFEKEHLSRFGIIKDNVDLKSILLSLGLKAQKSILSYQDY